MAKKFKPVAVVFADAHLCSRTWKHRQIFGDCEFAFQQVIDYAIEHNLPVVGAGDLIDKRVNESAPIVFLKEQLAKLEEADLRFLFLQGQHELDRVPWFQLGNNTEHIHCKEFMLGDSLKCYGIDFSPSDVFQKLLLEVPADTDVLFSHQVYADFMGSVTLPQGEFADIPYVKTLITGDFHKHVYDVYRNKDNEDLRVFSPGATHKRNISEPSEHYFGVLMENGAVLSVPLSSRHYEEYNLLTEEDIDRFMSDVSSYVKYASEKAIRLCLPPELETPLWRITYSADFNNIPRRVEEAVGDKAHLFWNEIPKKREDKQRVNVKATFASNTFVTMNDLLPDAVDPDKNSQEYALASQMLDSDEPEKAILEWFQQRIT